MTLVAHEKLQDRYEVVRNIKSGGMGSVYEAVDHKLASTPCAIKEVLASAMLGSSAAYVLQSFESEMRALAGLEHPNIPRVRDYFEIEGRRYIVLDLVQGQALDEELAEHLRLTNEPMDPAVAAVDMVSVLETLTYLHQCTPPIIHRDIKSANLIRDSRTGRIKMVDFGIARSVETQKAQTQVGTPGFCAPEQMGGRAEIRSDLYSVGATLYHLCTGRTPPAFTFESLEMDLPSHPGLVKIVLKATQPKPQDRYASAEEMAKALRAWLRNEASCKIDRATLPKAPKAAATKINPLATPPPPANSQNGLWVAVLAMLLAAGGLLYNDYSSRFATPTPSPTPKIAPAPAAPVARRPIAARVRQEVARRVSENRQNPPAVAARPPEKPQQQPQPPQQAQQRQQPEQPELPRLEVGSYPQAGDHQPQNKPPVQDPPSPSSQPPTQAPAENVAVVPRNGPYQLTARQNGNATFYEAHADGKNVSVRIVRHPDFSVEQIRNRALQNQPGWRRNPENEPGNEICVSRREGSRHHGFHFKDGLVCEIWVDPAPGPDPTFWGPILEVVRNAR